VLVYWDFWAGGLFLYLAPFLWGRVSVLSALPHHYCQCVMIVCCLFFNFAGQFDFGCCSLAQGMISVIHYLPCFGEWLITHLFCLSGICLLIVCVEISSLPIPPSLVHFQHSCPICYVLDYSSLFIVQLFYGWWVSLLGGCAGLS
jgi:hypothetical protein